MDKQLSPYEKKQYAYGRVWTALLLLLLAGWNGTAYYPSLTNMQSSLTISNSSSSLFTLRTMAWVSLFVPFVAAYIWYAWRAMNRRPPVCVRAHPVARRAYP